MPKFPQLKVAKRTILGRKVKQLRHQNLIPANVFGKKIASIPVQVQADVFAPLFEQVGETGIISLEIEGKTYPCLVKGLATNPVTDQILHVDFHHVSLTEKVTATIPVELTGEAPAVKEEGGVINQALFELEVEALPTDLPETFTIDIAQLTQLGQTITIADLKVAADVVISQEPETVIVTVVEPQPEEVEEPEAESEAETEAETPTKEGQAEVPATDGEDKEKPAKDAA